MQRFSLATTAVRFVVLASVLAFANAALSDTENVMQQPENSWVTLNGTVVEQEDHRFELDYGEGTITVEVDDTDKLKRESVPLENREVIVYGKVDTGFYEGRTIEADSVYVKDLNTLIHDPSPKDEEAVDLSRWVYYSGPTVDEFYVTGTVTTVDPVARTFTVNTNGSKITVDTTELPYNPLDAKGFQQVRSGDFVSVSGNLDDDVFDRAEVVAETVVNLE